MALGWGARIKQHGKLSDVSPPAPIIKTMISSCKISQSLRFARPGRGDSSAGRALSHASVRSEPAWSTELIVLMLNKVVPFCSDSRVCTRQGVCSTLTISRSGGCQEGQQAVGQGPAKLVKLRLTARGERGRGWTSHYGRTARTRRGPCLVWSRPTN